MEQQYKKRKNNRPETPTYFVSIKSNNCFNIDANVHDMETSQYNAYLIAT